MSKHVNLQLTQAQAVLVAGILGEVSSRLGTYLPYQVYEAILDQLPRNLEDKLLNLEDKPTCLSAELEAIIKEANE